MIRKKINKFKIFIILLILILLIAIIVNTFSLYESKASSNANIEVAFFLLKDQYNVQNVNLEKIIPRDEPYIYTFSISNSDGQKIAETDLEYELTIRTTTNLPLSYELYMNENVETQGATNIITSDEIITDEDETYFRILETENIEMNYTQALTNIYNLVVYFPSNYNDIDYQDIIESIEINVNAKQIVQR